MHSPTLPYRKDGGKMPLPSFGGYAENGLTKP